MYPSIVKPALDFIVAMIAFLLLLPVFIGVALLLWFFLKGNPFFFQTRPGKQERLFRIIKFRTMNNATDAAGVLLPDAERITTFGAIVRKTSLDEIPQLLNVLKGDMSIVGPRPLLPEYLPLYSSEQQKRHHVKPGITGYAQVNGRNAIDWDTKFELDVWYANHISFKTDFKILLKTVKKVLISEGVSAEGHVTMPTFVAYMKDKKTKN